MRIFGQSKDLEMWVIFRIFTLTTNFNLFNFMKTNMGTKDRLARVGMAILFSILYIYTSVESIWTVLLLFTGGYMVGSTAIGYCPVYDVVGVSTCKREKDQDD